MGALIIAVGLSSLCFIGRHFFGKRYSNKLSREDFQSLLIFLLLAAGVCTGPIIQLPYFRSLGAIVAVCATLFAAAVLIGLLTRQLKGFMAVGTWTYSPVFVRYWPSWVLMKTPLIVNSTTQVAFRLIPSMFDLRLVLVPSSSQGLDSAAAPVPFDDTDVNAEKRLITQDLVYPFTKLDESAITESGCFLTARDLTLQCDAPAFEPARQEFRTDIDTLCRTSLSFALVPKAAGPQLVQFRILGPDGIVRGSLTLKCTVQGSSSRWKGATAKAAAAIGLLASLIGSIASAIEKISKLIKP